MRIFFTRHGESEANVAQVISNRGLIHPLTARGRAQALALAQNLEEYNIEKIFASPILRAEQTAVVVADQLNISFTTASALREFDCGQMEGRSDEQAWGAYHALVQAWDVAGDLDCRLPPAGDSFNDMKQRFVPFIQTLVHGTALARGDILLISHGGLLLHMLPLVLDNIDRHFTQQNPLPNCALVRTEVLAGRLICRDWPPPALLNLPGT